MSKVYKLFKALGLIARKPFLLNRILDDDAHWKSLVSGKHKLENGLPVIGMDMLGSSLSGEVFPYVFLDGGSLPTDLLLLKKLAVLLHAKNYFEIGTWRGESVSAVADIAEECYTLNLSPGELLSLGYSEQYTAQVGLFSDGKPNVTQLFGHSEHFGFQDLNKKFDLVFIDGDHHYKSVRQDTENVIRYLTHERSVVVWHDYAFNPEMVRYEVLAGILDGLPQDLHPYLYHIAYTKCAVLFRESFPGKTLTYPVDPSSAFKITIEEIPR